MTRLPAQIQKQYLSKYYIDSYKIAMQLHINGIEIMDDERESLALAALEAAIANFDPSRNIKFSSYLYNLVKNKMYDFALRKIRAIKKGRPFSLQFVMPFSQDGTPDDAVNDEALFNLGHGGYLTQANPKLYEQLTEAIKQLTPRQQSLIECLMFPDEALLKYAKLYPIVTRKKIPHLTYQMIAKLLSISYAQVNTELNFVRKVLKTTVDNAF
jgi:RNA polymerase sigma factor (sigma-70 family)